MVKKKIKKRRGLFGFLNPQKNDEKGSQKYRQTWRDEDKGADKATDEGWLGDERSVFEGGLN